MANLLPLTASKFPPLGSSNLVGQSQSHFLINKNNKKNKPGYVSNVVEDGGNAVVKRPLANYPPDVWGDRFDNFTLEDQLRMERYAKESEPLIEEVRMMLLDEESFDLRKKMSLIDTVERLGFPYYYENEIKHLLDKVFKQLNGDNFNMDYDLWDIATQFRIFRQHGFYMPCDVFNKFLDGDNKFKEALRSDEKGMFSLYEAAHLRIHGEEILEEALDFTTGFLNSIADFSEQARKALLHPLHRGVPRVEVRHFISFYMEDESCNEQLLQLAKIEFNRLQLLHCQELSNFKKWWNNWNFAEKFPYMKQRSVECYFSVVALCQEPQYSFARKLCAQIFILDTLLDDTCDSYATFEEIQHLTDAFRRWDWNIMEHLPEEYLKNVHTCVIQTCNELAKEIAESGKSYGGQYLKEQFQLVIKNYLIEAKWLATRQQPAFAQYIANRRITIYLRVSLTAILLGMEEIRDAKPLEKLKQGDLKAQIASEMITGLLDDMVSGEAEIARGARNVTSIECYMKDYDKSREEVLQILWKMIEDAWKDLNNERLLIKDSDLSSKRLWEQILNYARVFRFFFRVGDDYALPTSRSIKEDIFLTFAEPFLV